MDISKASNFERFMFDVVGRDPGVVARAVGEHRARRRLRPRRHAALAASRAHRASSRAQHARRPHRDDPRRRTTRYGIVVDPHTADGIKVGLRACASRRAARVPRDGAAGEVRRDDPRGARPRAGAPGGLRGPRAAAAALRRAARRRRNASRRTSRRTRRRLESAASGDSRHAATRSPTFAQSRSPACGSRCSLPRRPAAASASTSSQLLLLLVVSARDRRRRIDCARFGADGYFTVRPRQRSFTRPALLLLSAGAASRLAPAAASSLLAMPVLVLAALSAAADRALRAVVCCFGPTWHDARVVRIRGADDPWIVRVLVRCVAIALSPPRRSLGARAPGRPAARRAHLVRRRRRFANDAWWTRTPPTAPIRVSPNPASEAGVGRAAEHARRTRSSGLEDERPTSRISISSASRGDAREDVFRRDVEAAQHVMDERWGTEGRSVVLINNPRTLLERAVRHGDEPARDAERDRRRRSISSRTS